ncbi:MAG: prolyl oligopeptidase family serine peptidase [Myxococcales bacterium]|nr:prolyl oligopeptidase family serine peptidase [Myxococcales bacterium]
MDRLVMALVTSALTACVYTPSSRVVVEKQNSVALAGYTGLPSQQVTIVARNNDTGQFVQVGAGVSAANEVTPGSGMYEWSANANVANAVYWAPSWLGAITEPGNSGGRLELRANVNGSALGTFTPEALQCALGELGMGASIYDAGLSCYDGREIVHYENTGLTQGADPNTWTTVSNGAGVGYDWEVFTYPSQGNDIYGIICRPTAAPPAGGFPLHVVNHGGTDGIFALDFVLWCEEFAQRGWVTAMSAYRGEAMFPDLFPDPSDPGEGLYKSDGVVEYCLGEVTDVMRMMEVIEANEANVNMDAALMTGLSHGGCITTRAVERGASVQAAVDLFGPSDWGKWFDDCGGCQGFKDELSGIIGDTPANEPQAYSWRSPGYHGEDSEGFAGDLAARTDVKLLIMHGTFDTLVPVDQSCELAYAAWGDIPGQFWFNAAGSPVGGGLNTCSQSAWNVGGVPALPFNAGWPEQRYLMIYDQLNHALTSFMNAHYNHFVDHLSFAP